MNPHFPIGFFVEHSEIPWEKSRLSSHPGLTIELVKNPPSHWTGLWDRSDLSLNPSITLEDILSYPKEFNLSVIAGNPNVPISHILAHPEYLSYRHRISQNLTLTPELVEGENELEFDPQELSSNPVLPVEWVIARCNPENIYDLEKHPHLTLAQVLAHPELAWK